MVTLSKLRKISGLSRSILSLLLKSSGVVFSNSSVPDKNQKLLLKLTFLLRLLTGNELKNFNLGRVRTLIQIKHYKGLRRTRSLPVRGQRTKTNAKTAKHRKLSFNHNA